MNFWHRNLEILREKNPELAENLSRVSIPPDHVLLPAKNGLLTLKVNRQLLHSAYDPQGEGEEWARRHDPGEGAAVVFGLGLGYHILPLLRANRRLWVVEPSAAVARLALEHQDLTPLLASDGLRVGRDFRELPPGTPLLAHPPSRRLSPALYRRLEAHLCGREPEGGGYLRILVVGPLYGGSQPIAGYCQRALAALGHRAELLDYGPFYQGYQALRQLSADKATDLRLTGEFLALLGEILLARVRDFHPDLVFFLAQAPVSPPLLQKLKREGPLLAFWFVEDFRVFPYWREVAPEVDVFFTLQEEPFFAELRTLGLKNYALLPLAADPEVYRPLSLSPEEIRFYGSAVSFVGAGYRNRQEFFQGLMDFDLKIWGSDWNLNSPLGPFIQKGGQRVSAEEAVKIFNASRINLNLHSSPYHDGINPEGDYLNPRTFDLAAAGAFQLLDHRLQLPAFFRPGEEVATFRDLPEAREKIAYYLAHPEARQEMAAKSRARVLRDHTYTRRLAQALSLIEDLCPGRLPRRPAPPRPLLELRRHFPAGHPVQALLRKLPPEVEDLSRLVAFIQEGQEPLTEAEALFWLLHEFHQGLQRGRF